MTTGTQQSLDKSYIESFSKANNEPEWFTNVRLNALEKYDSLEMPKPDKTKIDRWDFTSFKQHIVENTPFQTLNDLPEEVKALLGEDGEVKNLYVQQNQTPSLLIISENLKKQGVIFTDIFTAIKEHGELVQKYFMTEAVKVDEHKLSAFHAALMNGGAFIYVPKNVQVEEPIQAVFIHDNADAPLINHLLLVADENSSVTYVENYLSLNDDSVGVANIISEVIVRDHAQVRFGAVDTLASGVTTYVNRRGFTERNARLEWSLGLMNDGDTISENVTNLYGDGSIGDTKTVVVGTGKQTENFTTAVINHGKNSEGFILKHGVAKDRSTFIFNGIGKIEHGASGANAQQESRALMLSDQARADANPILLIDEDDVQAGHAASIGSVDPMQLFYLESRGIPTEDAKRLIIHGFLAPVVNQLPIEGVKKQLTEVIERKIR